MRSAALPALLVLTCSLGTGALELRAQSPQIPPTSQTPQTPQAPQSPQTLQAQAAAAPVQAPAAPAQAPAATPGTAEPAAAPAPPAPAPALSPPLEPAAGPTTPPSTPPSSAPPAAAAAPAGSPAPTEVSSEAEAARQAFMTAIERVRRGLPDGPDSSALRHYAIYPYLLEARLRRDLERAPDEALDRSIDAFLTAHAGQPVTHGLRRAWLSSLADRGRWDWFLPRAAEASDPVLVCDRWRGRIATGGTAGVAQEALARFSLPERTPHECDPVLDWLRSQGLITVERQEARARAALAANNPSLARELARELPAERAQPLLEWLQLLDSPKSSLNLLAMTPTLGVEPDALVAGFTRLAYIDANAAALMLPLLEARPDVTEPTRQRLRRAAALGAAFAHLPGAAARFQELAAPPSDTLLEEWRVRAALWAGDYGTALEWIEAMPASLAQQPRWRYWRARAVAALSGEAAAAPLFASIAGTRDYFGYLAADRLHRAYELHMRPSADDGALQAALAAEPGMIRAHELFDCDLTEEAQGEWAAALAHASAAQRIQAAHLAMRWGWYAQSIATLAQADEWDDVVLRYPRPYAGLVARASSLTQVPPDWLLAIMRQESLFRRDAVSRADARGLMQMQPATAAAVARRWRLPKPSRDALFDPEIAVPLGAAYVRELLDRYDHQLELTLAAYNAGPVSVARWLPSQFIDADVWIENIPYGETRAYVQHVLEHIVAFAAVRAVEPPRLSALLLPVGPSSAVTQAATSFAY